MRQLIQPLVAFWTTGMTACEEGPQPGIYGDTNATETWYSEEMEEEPAI